MEIEYKNFASMVKIRYPLFASSWVIAVLSQRKVRAPCKQDAG